MHFGTWAFGLLEAVGVVPEGCLGIGLIPYLVRFHRTIPEGMPPPKLALPRKDLGTTPRLLIELEMEAECKFPATYQERCRGMLAVRHCETLPR